MGQLWDDGPGGSSGEGWDDIDYPDVDADLGDAADAPLLDPGSDGLSTQSGPHLLMDLARRRAQGASLAELRRSAGQIDPFVVSDRTLERAVDQGARLNAWEGTGRIPERLHKRWYRGISVRPCPACGQRVLSRALRRAGCVLCTEGA